MGYVLHLVVAQHTTVATSTQKGRQFGEGGNNSVIRIAFGVIGVIVTLLLLGRFCVCVCGCDHVYACAYGREGGGSVERGGILCFCVGSEIFDAMVI